MASRYRRSLFLFRRDLRVHDNRALKAACAASRSIVPAFIFDPRQANADENEYFSRNAFEVLTSALADLASDLEQRGGRLYVFEGHASDVLDALLQGGTVDAVYVSRDYTPFAQRRDHALAETAERHGADFHAEPNVLLTEPEEVVTQSGDPFFVYSHFRKAAREVEIPAPVSVEAPHWETRDGSVDTVALEDYRPDPNADLKVSGRREDALQVLDRMDEYRYYSKKRHRMDAYGQATRCSAALKFGTVSPREVYHAVRREWGPRHKLNSQLLWRDFYTHFAHHFPSVFGQAIRPKDRFIDWRDAPEDWQRWCEGRTGVPIVDAGMRELVATGYMHNRARMSVASFLTKHLRIDWRRGERFFARHLLDYDPSVNNGNWQWSASVGLDSIPMRMFNPYTQVEKYDKGAEYVRHWVPELRAVSADLLTSGDAIDFSTQASDYPAPIVDHGAAYQRAKETYSTAMEEAKANGYGRYDVTGR